MVFGIFSPPFTENFAYNIQYTVPSHIRQVAGFSFKENMQPALELIHQKLGGLRLFQAQPSRFSSMSSLPLKFLPNLVIVPLYRRAVYVQFPGD